jgi:hypothetical protein
VRGLELAATFPYLEVGDDLNNPLTGRLAWTGLTLDTQTRSWNAGPCLRTDATVHADAGLTAWLFGLRTRFLAVLHRPHRIGVAAAQPSVHPGLTSAIPHRTPPEDLTDIPQPLTSLLRR